MKRILLVLAVLFLAGCDKITYFATRYSPLQEEQAEVVSMTYVPERSDTTVGVGPIFSGDGGMAVTVGSVSSPEVWAVRFRCEKHNKTFILQSKEVFSKAKIGEKVTLKYVDEIRYTKKLSGEIVPYTNEVVGQHTKQIIFASGTVNR